jgi:hypothetical protein
MGDRVRTLESMVKAAPHGGQAFSENARPSFAAR